MGIRLHDGSRIGVVGGGPAGSLCAYFLLTFARRMDLHLCLDIYEPRDFTQTGPDGCNMCGGIVSESLVQALAVEGIGLPPSVVQRGIDSYVLCTVGNRVRIDMPSKEKRIAAVHRGGGPRDLREVKWGGLDGYLLTRARELGAVVVPARVSDVGWDNGRPQVHLQNTSYTYDLLIGASGVNSAGWQLYEKLGLRSRRPDTTRAYITELPMGEESITRHFGSSMHVFLLDIPRLDFASHHSEGGLPHGVPPGTGRRPGADHRLLQQPRGQKLLSRRLESGPRHLPLRSEDQRAGGDGPLHGSGGPRGGLRRDPPVQGWNWSSLPHRQGRRQNGNLQRRICPRLSPSLLAPLSVHRWRQPFRSADLRHHPPDQGHRAAAARCDADGGAGAGRAGRGQAHEHRAVGPVYR